MNINANELAGKHIGDWIILGGRKAQIEKFEATPETVNIRAVALHESGYQEHFALSVPATAVITIQEQ